MKVIELKQMLNDFSDDAEVMTASPSHDYWGSVQALKINQVDLAYVKYSDYHQSDKVIDDYDGNDEDVREVVLISR